jgi:hypothetical protein
VPSQYGFHATVVDGLYFWTQADKLRAVNEARRVAGSIQPFELTRLEVALDYPKRGAASVRFEDPSRTLELLHHELVYRVNRRAAASNYTLSIAPQVRGGERSHELINRRYKAPYVLQEFQPHFTLLENLDTVSDPVRDRVLGQLRDRLQAAVGPSRSVRICKLAFMMRDGDPQAWTANNNRWRLLDEIGLGATRLSPAVGGRSVGSLVPIPAWSPRLQAIYTSARVSLPPGSSLLPSIRSAGDA